MVPRPARPDLEPVVKLRAQERKGATDLLFLIELCMSTLSCADIDGATLNLYSPLFRWQPAEGELYHESLMRRMRDILARTRDNPSTAYFGACWCCAHIKAFRISERDGVGVDKIYAANAAPEMATAKDIPCIDTSHAYEADLMDIFNPSTATATVAARLIGKGLKPNASVRYVKSQIVKHLQSIEAPEFVMFVLVAAVLGLYPSVHTRANVSAYIDIARRGTNAILDCIDPLSSREIFGLVCEFLVHCGARHPILKRLCEVPQTMDAVAFCDNTVRPKIHDKPVVRVRRKAPPQPAGQAIPALHDLWAEASLNRKVSSAVVTEVGGFEAAAKLYTDFMADSQILPRGMQFARPVDPNPKKDAAVHKLMMHASREACSRAEARPGRSYTATSGTFICHGAAVQPGPTRGRPLQPRSGKPTSSAHPRIRLTLSRCGCQYAHAAAQSGHGARGHQAKNRCRSSTTCAPKSRYRPFARHQSLRPLTANAGLRVVQTGDCQARRWPRNALH